MIDDTKTVYRALVEVTLVIYGPHSPTIAAGEIASCLPQTAETKGGGRVTFGPVPQVVYETPYVRQRRGWRRALEQQKKG